MLRRNRFGFRMRRRSLTGRLFQFLVVLTVVSLFIYLVLYASSFGKDYHGPDFTWLKTRNMSEYVRPEESTALNIPDEGFCKAEDKLRLLVVVHSAPSHTTRRSVIRSTWGKAMKSFPGVRMVFMLGQASRTIQEDIDKEVTEFGDVIQEDFVDVFVNLTLKTTFMFKWIVSTECLTSKFLFKTDDDTFVNPTQLWAALEHSLLYSATTKSLLPFFKKNQLANQEIVLKNKPEAEPGPEPLMEASVLSESIDYLVMGKVIFSVPIRDVNHKLYLPSRFYPLNIFPKHLSGSGYVLSMSIVPLLYECMLRTPYMNLEDIMLTGLCATTQMGLSLTNHPGFLHKKPAVGPDYVCFYKKSAFVHGLSGHEMADMWERISEDHNCDTFYFATVEFLTAAMELVKTIFGWNK